jgi:hypothetical protein
MKHRFPIIATIFSASLVLAGCATQVYFLNGVKFPDKDSFTAAYRAEQTQDLNNVKPLTQQVSAKKLRVVLPSRDRYMGVVAKLEGTRLNRTVTRDELEKAPLVLFPLEDYENQAQMIQKKALYSNTEIVHTDSSGDPDPSDTSDVVWMYLAEVIGKRGGWYFLGSRTGKQPLPIDGALSTRFERVGSLIDGIKGAAIQNK